MARVNDLESINSASIRLGMDKSYLYRLIQQGKLDHYEIGNRKFVAKRDITGMIRYKERKAQLALERMEFLRGEMAEAHAECNP